MAIQIKEQGNGVLFNGNLTDKQGWILSPNSDQSKVSLTNRITGVSATSSVVEVEVDGSTFADYDALVAALGNVLFKSGGTGPGTGVQSVTGDGVDNTDPGNPSVSYPTPADIGAAPISHTHNASDINEGTLADGRIPSLAISKTTGLQSALDGKQPLLTPANAGTNITIDASNPNVPIINATGEPSGSVSWDDVTDKPAVIGAGATQDAARTALGLGTASTQASTDFATSEQGTLAETALQPGDGVPWSDVTGVPAALTTAQEAGTASIREIGTTGTTAAAGNHTHSPATTSVDGFMAAADKTKLNGIAEGANVGVVSQQQGGVGTLINNIIEVTQSEYDNLTPQAGTIYAIVG